MHEGMKQLIIELGRSITELNYQRDRLMNPRFITEDVRGWSAYEPWWYSNNNVVEDIYTEDILPGNEYTNYN